MKRRSFFAMLTGSVAAIATILLKKEPRPIELPGYAPFDQWDGFKYPTRFILCGENFVKVEPLIRKGNWNAINPAWINAPYEMTSNVTVSSPGWQEVQWSIEKRVLNVHGDKIVSFLKTISESDDYTKHPLFLSASDKVKKEAISFLGEKVLT